ncbi:MAG: L-arabinose transport system permease protein AraQ [Chloroflexi bacterium ADurb.Bin325]|nr:MAG: L-arabinose transport system permease protein AraQ [Chloroflexi bacterium ADurb.Bin325]
MSTPSAYVVPASEGSLRHQHSLRFRATAALSALLKYGALVLLSGFFILPWVWMLSTSLKNPNELAIWPPIWIPNPIRWDNYISAFKQALFATYVLNTLIVALPSVIGAVLSNTLVAYGFARVRWPGRDAVFAVVLATMILPGFVTFIPLYIIFSRIGWVNTYLPLVAPAWLGNAFYIFLLRQFFMGLPQELSDAARVDGASDLGIFWRIILPLAKPAIAVVALFQFISSWNDYFGPLIYLSDKARYTISLGIANMQSTYGFMNFAWIMAATVMSVLPIVILFFFAQRTFIEGIALTGLKG